MLMLAACAGAGVERMYHLGPDDQIIVRAVDVEEFPDQPVRIDSRGSINLPLVGRVQAGGLTIAQLEGEIALRLGKFLHDPHVTVAIAEFRSQPVSVFGAVTRPGVMQLRGPMTLWEVISEAGGLKNDAGEKIKITRRLDQGPLSLPGARVDETGRFSVAEVDVRSVTEMTNPDENILMMADDVVSVSRANIVYVVGHVNKSGGFVTNGPLSVLEALSLAGGFKPNASSKKARILRLQPGLDQRRQIALNLKDVLRGKAEDVALKPNDILFVPHSTMQDIAGRAVTAALGVASGVAIWRLGYGYR
jgi:polysaccharide export outer membrane protein